MGADIRKSDLTQERLVEGLQQRLVSLSNFKTHHLRSARVLDRKINELHGFTLTTQGGYRLATDFDNLDDLFDRISCSRKYSRYKTHQQGLSRADPHEAAKFPL